MNFDCESGFTRRLPVLLVIAGVLMMMFGNSAWARVEIDITKGNVEPLPIAINNFGGDQVARDIAAVVEADLRGSGLFRPIDKGAFIDKNTDPNARPRFDDWRVINAQALVID